MNETRILTRHNIGAATSSYPEGNKNVLIFLTEPNPTGGALFSPRRALKGSGIEYLVCYAGKAWNRRPFIIEPLSNIEKKRKKNKLLQR